MDNEPKEEQESVKIFGRELTKREAFWNGVVFLFLEIAYKVFYLYPQIPEGASDNPDLLNDINLEMPPWYISLLLFFAGYWLIDRSVFGNDVGKNVEKFGVRGYFVRKFSLAITIILVTLLLDIVATVAIILL